MNCKICNSQTKKIFNKTVLNKYPVDYFQCLSCDFIQTAEPHWLNEAYKDPINTSDTGLLSRNIVLSKIASLIILLNLNKNGVFLDYAGGYGVFTRLMRDNGFNFLWQDYYTQNLFAKGFEFDEKNHKIELITTFESFEHLPNPIEEIEKMLNISKTIFFSTELMPCKDIEKWAYISPEHGQHIAFYSNKTLETIAKKYNLNFYTNNKNLHLFSDKKLYVPFKIIQLLRLINLELLIKKIVGSKTLSDSISLKKNDY